MTTPYDILGVKPDATPSQIKKGYRKKAKTAHPDAGGKPEDFHKIQRAFALLMDAERRADFDATGNADEPPAMPEPMTILMECFGQCLGMFVEGRLEDIATGIKSGIQNAIDQTQGEIHKTNEKLKRLEKIVGKIEFTGEGVNYTGEQTRAVYESYKQNLAKGIKRKAEYEAALVLAPLYQFPKMQARFNQARQIQYHMGTR